MKSTAHVWFGAVGAARTTRKWLSRLRLRRRRSDSPSIAIQLWRMTEHGPVWTGKIGLVPEAFDEPRHWRKPCRVFVNSMSDLFHEGVPLSYLQRLWQVMEETPRHTYQILTKRQAHMQAVCAGLMNESLKLLPNVWLGVSVEDQANADARIPLLLQTPAAVRFLSVEPLLAAVDLTKSLATGQIHWVIVGGESGPLARRHDLEWDFPILAQCRAAGVAYFEKQLGTNAWFNNQRLRLRDSHGGDIAEWPADLRLREYPRSQRAQGEMDSQMQLRLAAGGQ